MLKKLSPADLRIWSSTPKTKRISILPILSQRSLETSSLSLNSSELKFLQRKSPNSALVIWSPLFWLIMPTSIRLQTSLTAIMISIWRRLSSLSKISVTNSRVWMKRKKKGKSQRKNYLKRRKLTIHKLLKRILLRPQKLSKIWLMRKCLTLASLFLSYLI